MEKNGHRADVPILGNAAFTCKRGHVYNAPQAWRWNLQVSKNVVLTGPPMCPWCFMDEIALRNPSWKQGRTLEEAVAAGELNPAVLEGWTEK